MSFAFYDPVQEPRVHRGYTAFRLDMFYDASFQYRWEDGAAGRSVTIQTRIGNIRYRLSNRVELPQYLDNNDRWNDSLVRHEFDHVAMTVDPRVRMLFEHLCRKVAPISRRLPLASPINDAVVKAIIHEEVERRCNAVIDLLIANEHALDVATSHGSRQLADRAAYFRSARNESPAARISLHGRGQDLLQQGIKELLCLIKDQTKRGPPKLSRPRAAKGKGPQTRTRPDGLCGCLYGRPLWATVQRRIANCEQSLGLYSQSHRGTEKRRRRSYRPPRWRHHTSGSNSLQARGARPTMHSRR